MVRFETLTGFNMSINSNRGTILYYGNLIVMDIPPNAEKKIEIGKILLSKAGQELATICGSKAVDGFIEYAVKKWSEHCAIASSPWPRVVQS